MASAFCLISATLFAVSEATSCCWVRTLPCRVPAEVVLFTRRRLPDLAEEDFDDGVLLHDRLDLDIARCEFAGDFSRVSCLSLRYFYLEEAISYADLDVPGPYTGEKDYHSQAILLIDNVDEGRLRSRFWIRLRRLPIR